jgi:hypothetical protein
MQDTSLAFGDLKFSLDDLNANKNSPVRVRRSFVQFITLSKQLTETMRREYSKLTTQKWEASLFTKWTPITKLFIDLRNYDQHEAPIIINIRENHNYLTHILEDEEGNEYHGYSVFQVLRSMDPFSDEVQNLMSVKFFDEEMKEIENEEPESIDYEYEIHPKTKEIKNKLEEIGINDLHELINECFKTIQEYYDFYKEMLNKNKINNR